MAELLERLEAAVARDQLRAIDLALADWCLRHGGSGPVALAMALASRAVGEGHACLELGVLEPAVPGESPYCSPETLQEACARSPLVGRPGEARPLILDGARLYLHRYWLYEHRLAEGLGRLLAAPARDADLAPLRPEGGLFDDAWTRPGETNWQAVAAAVALRHRIAVISGGPGTGKTYTVLRLIRLLVDAAEARGEPDPLIRLAAPTGKAAARMMESVLGGLTGLPDGEALRPRLPEKASTLHRLLGLRRGTTRPRYHRGTPLEADVVIVDEASMVDLPMMAKLVDAIPDQARLILLGDRFQLVSVEAGSVLAALSEAAGVNTFSGRQREALAPLLMADAPPAAERPATPLADHVVTLQTSHRFHPSSPIGRLAAAVNAGNSDGAVAVGGEARGDIRLRLEASPDLDALARELAGHYAPLVTAEAPDAALATLDGVRLLTATRVGPAGSEAMNRGIRQHLAEIGGFDPERQWYHGRPVIVLQNDYRVGLFNGDTGVCLRGVDGQLRVWFRTEDGLTGLLPTSLPAVDTVFAMTVHKSQGSEFRRVVLLLPDRDNPVLSRELVYTGITRAREHLTLVAPEAVLRQAIGRRTRRASGLADRLARLSSPA